MAKENKELNKYDYLKHKTSQGECYFLTILDDSGVKTINLTTQNKDVFYFGTSTENDIVVYSETVDTIQGYIELTEYGVLAVNTSNKIPMIGNKNKEYNDIYLSDGSFIKILDPNDLNKQGIIMIMSIEKNLNEWKVQHLQMGKISIGSSGICEIILPPNGVAKRHASIYYGQGKVAIQDEASLNGTYINGIKISSQQKYQLNNLDVIYIGNTKMIINGDTLIYQIKQSGVQLDAIDIVKRVRIKFEIKEISSHVNLSIHPGEFVAFVGGSGAGKSTCLKCISGVIKPTSGRVLVNGEDLYENYETLKYNIGYVPQEDIVFSNLTLHDMLQYAAKLRMPDSTTKKERRERINQVLEIVQLSDFENSYIRQLSGGQRKRASIAVELIANPNLFFLDEPTSGLDPGTERSIMKTLQAMARMGKTIILVTHNTLNLHLCDKVAFFGADGKLCFYGRPQEALDFFGVSDFVDIYTLISEDLEQWCNKFQNSEYAIVPEPVEKETNKVEAKKKSFLKQLINLISRNIKLITNDIQQLLMLFAQAPIIAVLLAIVSSDELYSGYEDTKTILFSIGCACIWLGLLNSIQEICKEKVILQKEYMADLKLSAYLFSKFIVQGILAFIQSFVVVFIFQKIAGSPTDSILINPFWDTQIICFISILSAAALGLFLSALVKSSNITMTIIPLILVPQLLFSGMLFKLEGGADFISNFILCRWTVEGLGTTVNLNSLTHLVQKINPLIQVEEESYFLFTNEHMLKVFGVISLMTIVLMIASYIILRKNINKNM